jgi:glycosyltransferase involved in cell wall biosynthesis
MASGKPVVAFGRGGALETVVDTPLAATGVFFQEQTTIALADALARLKHMELNPHTIRARAEQFDRGIFKERYRTFVEETVNDIRF